jgi:hypothetical protein
VYRTWVNLSFGPTASSLRYSPITECALKRCSNVSQAVVLNRHVNKIIRCKPCKMEPGIYILQVYGPLFTLLPCSRTTLLFKLRAWTILLDRPKALRTWVVSKPTVCARTQDLPIGSSELSFRFQPRLQPANGRQVKLMHLLQTTRRV